MLEWLRVHWGTIFIALIVLAVIAGAPYAANAIKITKILDNLMRRSSL